MLHARNSLLVVGSVFARSRSRQARVNMKAPQYHNGKKHLPVPSGNYFTFYILQQEIKISILYSNVGRFVVGCTDVMIGPNTAEGCFLRLYYPSVLKDAYVISKVAHFKS